MKISTPIPKELSHLKLDERGYPIPFFVSFRDGKPDFRLLDPKKQSQCIEHGVCSICGKKLTKGAYFFLGGPLTLKNTVSSDPPMHRVCAEFSLAACPHLYLQKAQRRDTGLETGQFNSALLSLDKPSHIFLIRAYKFKSILHPDHAGKLIKFSITDFAVYSYRDGKLSKQ